MTNTEIKLNAWGINYESQIAVQGEVNSRALSVTLIDKVGSESYISNAESVDRPINLTEVTARLYVIKPDGTKTFTDGTVTDAENGKVKFTLPAQAVTVAGNIPCQILLTKLDNSTLIITGLTLEVQPSNLEGAIESSDDFSALVVALNSVNAAVASVEQAVLDSNTAVENANIAISGANTAADNANAKATLANTAATTANTAASNADAKAVLAVTATTNANTATSAANTATTNANTAADRANTAAQNAEDAIAGQLDPAIDARITAKVNVAGGIAGYDNAASHYADTVSHVTQADHDKITGAVQSATIGGAVVPKSGTTLQLPAYPTIPGSLPANGGTADYAHYSSHAVGSGGASLRNNTATVGGSPSGGSDGDGWDICT